ncbi:hypothetical protein AGMMS49975_29240 [Clostridia bacterium]|nr:hypothetical protein AGMMS49975_29240 [Clostridia bacterium]
MERIQYIDTKLGAKYIAAINEWLMEELRRVTSEEPMHTDRIHALIDAGNYFKELVVFSRSKSFVVKNTETPQ